MQFANRTKRAVTVTYGPFTVTLDPHDDQVVALPVASGDNIHIGDHKLSFDRSLACFFAISKRLRTWLGGDRAVNADRGCTPVLEVLELESVMMWHRAQFRQLELVLIADE